MLGTTERLGFEALCRSKESPAVAFAGVTAIGLSAFAYHRASRSEAETYDRLEAKRDLRREATEAIELRPERVTGSRDATEKFRENWERTYRRPFPYEIDAYGRVRPEGSREEFKYLPDIDAEDLDVILRARRQVPTVKELELWHAHIADDGPSVLSRASALSQAIEHWRSKGVEDAWIPVLWTRGDRVWDRGPNPPTYRSPEHAAAYAEIVKKWRIKDDVGYVGAAQDDLLWTVVKDSRRPLQDLRKIEEASKAVKESGWVESRLSHQYEAQGERSQNRDLRDFGAANVLRRLLDLNASREAIAVATMASTLEIGAKDIETLSLLVDKNVSKVKNPEDRKRVAAATILDAADTYPKLRASAYIADAFWQLNRNQESFKPLAPQFPSADNMVSAKIASGKSLEQVMPKIPKKFAIAMLAQPKGWGNMWGYSEREVRREYVKSECENAMAKWFGDPNAPEGYYTENLGDLLSGRPAVAEWVASVCKDKPRLQALTTTRRFAVQGGGPVIEGRLIDRVDEIDDQDIRSPKDSVTDVFERASARIAKEMEREYMKEPNVPLGAVPEWWPTEGIAHLEKSGIKVEQLRTARELTREGSQMKHCVGTYCPRVQHGEAFIASMTLPSGERTTLDFSRDGTLRQNYTYKNQRPSDEAIAYGKYLEIVAKQRLGTR